jgi:hypothetical protein
VTISALVGWSELATGSVMLLQLCNKMQKAQENIFIFRAML